MEQSNATQILGWGGALIGIALILGLLVITGIIMAAVLPWIIGLALVTGIIMAVVGAAGRGKNTTTRT